MYTAVDIPKRGTIHLSCGMKWPIIWEGTYLCIYYTMESLSSYAQFLLTGTHYDHLHRLSWPHLFIICYIPGGKR